eukprot:2580116-Rhodomonas_salina.2
MTCSSSAHPGALQASSRPQRGLQTSCPRHDAQRLGCRELRQGVAGGRVAAPQGVARLSQSTPARRRRRSRSASGPDPIRLMYCRS